MAPADLGIVGELAGGWLDGLLALLPDRLTPRSCPRRIPMYRESPVAAPPSGGSAGAVGRPDGRARVRGRRCRARRRRGPSRPAGARPHRPTPGPSRLSTATLRRITCDCSISRVITDGPSRVLDVGRATRSIPPAIRRALVARDRHCRAPGCDRPPAWCDGHHIRHWEDGGPTSLDNLVLLCRRHHREMHLRC